MQAYLLHHLQGIIVTQLTVKDKIDHVEGIANLLQQPLDVTLNKTQRWAEVHLATILTFPLCRFVQVLCGSPRDAP